MSKSHRHFPVINLNVEDEFVWSVLLNLYFKEISEAPQKVTDFKLCAVRNSYTVDSRLIQCPKRYYSYADSVKKCNKERINATSFLHQSMNESSAN